MKGIGDSTIMTFGRWKSNAYRYVRIPQKHLAQLSCHITTPIPPANLQVLHPLLEDSHSIILLCITIKEIVHQYLSSAVLGEK